METRSKRGHGYALRSKGCSKYETKAKIKGKGKGKTKFSSRSPKKPKPSDELEPVNEDHALLLKQYRENVMDSNISFTEALLTRRERRLGKELEQQLKQARENRFGLPGSSKREQIVKDHYDSMWEFSRQALEFYRKRGGGRFQLVKAVSIGQDMLLEGLVRHINFEAKKENDPTGTVLTFFAQLTEFEKDRVDTCLCLGPSDKLPEYGDTRGCDICVPGAVHHPTRSPKEPKPSDELEAVNEAHARILKQYGEHQIDANMLPESSKREQILKDHYDSMREYSKEALEFYCKCGGGSFQLVEAVSIGQDIRQEGLVRHINFKAKKENDPTGMVLTFFAQLIKCEEDKDCVDICLCLGPTAKIPEYGDTRGCNICVPGAVHHPVGPRGIKFIV